MEVGQRYGTDAIRNLAVRNSANGTAQLRYGMAAALNSVNGTERLRYETAEVKELVNCTERLRYKMDSAKGTEFAQRYGTVAIRNG